MRLSVFVSTPTSHIRAVTFGYPVLVPKECSTLGAFAVADLTGSYHQLIGYGLL